MTMQFFLHEIAARLLAIYLGLECLRNLYHGFTRKHITFHYEYFLFLGWTMEARKQHAPILYWIVICLEIIGLLACGVVAIFGWWHPGS